MKTKKFLVIPVLGLLVIGITGVVSNGAANIAGRAYVTDSGSNNVSVINTETNTVIASVNVGSYPNGVAVNPAGTRVYVANTGSSNVSVIDTGTNTVIASVNVSSPVGIAVNPAGTRVYVTSNPDNVSVIDTATNTIIGSVNYPGNGGGITVNPTGTRVYVAGWNNVYVFDTSTNTFIDSVNVESSGQGIEGITVNSAGTRVYVTDADYNVSVIDTATNTAINTMNADIGPIGLVLNPNGKFLYVANEGAGDVQVIDTKSFKILSAINLYYPIAIPNVVYPTGIAINSKGTKVYVAGTYDTCPNGICLLQNQGMVSIIDTKTETIVGTINVGGHGYNYGIAVIG